MSSGSWANFEFFWVFCIAFRADKSIFAAGWLLLRKILGTKESSLDR